MRHPLRLALILGSLSALALLASRLLPPEARAQRARVEAEWEYKVAVFSYNPGERLTDDQRARSFEKLLNNQSRSGWEPVGSLLSRDTVQTVGGAVTTRETTSFVGFRRTRR